jgi:hypothetical protein
VTTPLGTDTVHYTWRIEAGERERLQIPIFGADGTTPQDVTDYTVDAKIRTEQGGEVLYTFPAEHIEITDNVIELRIPGPTSAAWTWTVGWWRVVITAPEPDPTDPDSSRVVQGAFIVDPD